MCVTIIFPSTYLLLFSNSQKHVHRLDGGRVYAACLILVVKLKAQVAAKVTAITAMLISGVMILYAVISFFKTSYGLFLGLVGVFVFYESYELWTAARRNELEGHSIFGRKCYQDAVAPSTGTATTQNAETEIV